MSRVAWLILVLAVILLGSLTLGGPLATAAQESTPTAGDACLTTTPEENEALVQRFYEAVGSGDDAELATLLADDHVYRDETGEHSPRPGAEGAADWAGERRQQLSNPTVSLDPILAEDDWVATYVTWSGSLPDTGEATEWVGLALFRIECGTIAETWSVADNLSRMMDLGVITEEELQSVASPKGHPDHAGLVVAVAVVAVPECPAGYSPAEIGPMATPGGGGGGGGAGGVAVAIAAAPECVGGGAGSDTLAVATPTP